MWSILANEMEEREPVSLPGSSSKTSLCNSWVCLFPSHEGYGSQVLKWRGHRIAESLHQVLKWWGHKIAESLHRVQQPGIVPDPQQILTDPEIHFYILNHWDLGVVITMPKANLTWLIQGSDHTNTKHLSDTYFKCFLFMKIQIMWLVSLKPSIASPLHL